MGGRPLTPNAILKKRGSKHVREDEPEFTEGIGNAPDYITGEALKIWEETVDELAEAGIGSKVERHALAVYCQAVATFKQAQEEIERVGLTVSNERGTSRNPAVLIQNQAAATIHKYASSFGFTPSSRGKLHGPPKEEYNEFDED